MRRVLALALATAPALAVATSCLAPTQITVKVLTDFECESSMTTEIRAGDAPSARKTGCEKPREVGDVVLVPSSKPGRFTVRVNASTSLGAIEAVRSVAYTAHASIELPITLYAACAGWVCAPGETCVVREGKPTCISAFVDPSACPPPRVCDDAVLDAGAPKPPLPLDAGADVAADVVTVHVLDGGLCAFKNAQGIGKKVVERWTFDKSTLVGENGFGKNSSPLGCATFGSTNIKGCGSMLDLRSCPPSTLQTLESAMPSPDNFEVAIRFNVNQPGLVAEHASVSNRGFRLFAEQDFSLKAVFLGVNPVEVPISAWQPNTWVEAHVYCDAQNCGLRVGLKHASAGRPQGIPADTGALRLGPGIAFDALEYFNLDPN